MLLIHTYEVLQVSTLTQRICYSLHFVRIPRGPAGILCTPAILSTQSYGLPVPQLAGGTGVGTDVGAGTGVGSLADVLVLLLFRMFRILVCSSACFGSLTASVEVTGRSFASPSSTCTCSSRFMSRYFMTRSYCRTVS